MRHSILANISPASTSRQTKQKEISSGKQTLRLRNDQPAVIEETSEKTLKGLKSINTLLEIYLGISDTELGKSCLFKTFKKFVCFRGSKKTNEKVKLPPQLAREGPLCLHQARGFCSQST
jgi:copper oxidase (laccase) domain-containing protein